MLIGEDSIFGGGGSMDFVFGIRHFGHQAGEEVFGQEYLPGMRNVASREFTVSAVNAATHLEVDVVGPTHVEPRDNGLKVHCTIAVRDLNAPEKGQLVSSMVRRRRSETFGRSRPIAGMLRIEVWRRASRPHRVLFRKAGIQTQRIAAPYIHGNTLKRFAASRIQNADA